MISFRNLPIQKKVATVVLAVFATALGLAAAGIFLHYSFTYRQRAEAELLAHANLLSVAMDSPVAWDNRLEGAMVLERLRRNTEVAAAFVLELSQRGKVFVQDPTNAVLPEFLDPHQEGARFHQGELWLVKDLRRDRGGAYATLVLHSHLEGMRREQVRSFAVLGLILLLLLLPSYMVATYLARSLTAPLSALAATVHQISTRKGERIRAPQNSQDEIGRLAGDFNSMLDVLEKREADLVATERRAAADREKLENQVHQSQKMEAVGQLAGGIAHDFNNLLQVINGFTSLAMEQLPPGSPVTAELNEVLQAGERAKQLVSQLLTFSRRQVSRPEDLDLGQVTDDFLKLIKRVLGEHIRIEFDQPQNRCLVRADRGQMEQVLMNLCVNARDAMPEGGSIKLSLESITLDDSFCRIHTWATPGSYARLSVADTGCGMDAETQQRIFEPFFTTKAPGKGTGLGLATVYGIIQQHHGSIQVYSEPGCGSIFRLYLPLTEVSAANASAPQNAEVRGGTETILLAEDEEMVRNLTCRILRNAGYTVLTANDGAEAVTVFQQNHSQIHLALLDVVMPRMGGWAASKELRELRPDLPIIFASGYNPEQAQPGFTLGENTVLLGKPFAPANLLRCIREALDRSRAPASSELLNQRR
jgi:signal transduction histidine kinase/ActR/RegA family two-component response regulator